MADIHRGEDGWLYLGPARRIRLELGGRAFMSTRDRQAWAACAAERAAWCAARGLRHAFLVAPDKHVVYPEHVPFREPVATRRYVHEFLEQTGEPGFYPLDVLLDAKARFPVYQSGDSHWNRAGAALAFNAWAKRLGIPFRIPIEDARIVTTTADGDLCGRLDPPARTNTLVDFPFTPEARLAWTNGLGSYGRVSVHRKDAPGLPRAVCFGDSFAGDFLDLLAEYFSELVFVSIDADGPGFFPGVAEQGGFDLVLSQLVERSLPNYVAAATGRFAGRQELAASTKEEILSGRFGLEDLAAFRSSLQDGRQIYADKDREALSYAASFHLAKKKADAAHESADLQDYLRSLGELSHLTVPQGAAAIVMNCNPFTLGHRHLIEHVAAQCGRVFVFLLEEDRSYFTFFDRLTLCIQGTADLENVFVLPSGRHIISASTFKDYFNKDTRQSVTIDATLDLEIFAHFIAPKLGITRRFVGTEPYCRITNQYNSQMRALLPGYGIEVTEIDRRLDAGGAAISASRVRKLLEAGDWAGLEKLVPPTTLAHLRARAPLPEAPGQPALADESSLVGRFAALHVHLTGQGRLADAESVMAYLFRLADADLLARLAESFLARGARGEAKRLLFELKRRQPGNVAALLRLSEIHLAEGLVAEAAREVAQALPLCGERSECVGQLRKLYAAIQAAKA